MAHEYPTVLDLVGHTPLARLQRIVPDGAATVLAKLEWISPGGSDKLIYDSGSSGQGVVPYLPLNELSAKKPTTAGQQPSGGTR